MDDFAVQVSFSTRRFILLIQCGTKTSHQHFVFENMKHLKSNTHTVPSTNHEMLNARPVPSNKIKHPTHILYLVINIKHPTHIL